MTINIDPAKIDAKVKEAWSKGMPELAEIIKEDCNEFCKIESGALRASAVVGVGSAEGHISWNTVYARRQYWEIPTARAAGTQWQWCEGAKGQYSQKWLDIAQSLFGSNL